MPAWALGYRVTCIYVSYGRGTPLYSSMDINRRPWLRRCTVPHAPPAIYKQARALQGRWTLECNSPVNFPRLPLSSRTNLSRVGTHGRSGTVIRGSLPTSAHKDTKTHKRRGLNMSLPTIECNSPVHFPCPPQQPHSSRARTQASSPVCALR